jgi:hypothetical protein
MQFAFPFPVTPHPRFNNPEEKKRTEKERKKKDVEINIKKN